MSDSRIDQWKNDAQKTIAHLGAEYAKLQTGRANASLVSHIEVEAYGQKQSLQSIAGIGVEDARTIMIQPWDKSILSAVEKAVLQADLGSSPINDGQRIRVVLPPMTEERRMHLKKLVHQLAEEARIAIRQLRQHTLDMIKKEEDEDDRERLQKELQHAVDDANNQIEQIRKRKEEEVTTI